MWNIWPATLDIVYSSAIWLLLGFSLAGFLHVFLNRYPGLMEPLTRSGNRPVFLAAIIGLPLPLCSCGVLPAALALRKKGASKGATASFLISVPETDIVSILLTFALMGPIIAVYRPIAALLTAVVTGLVVNRLENRSVGEVPTAQNAEENDCCDEDDLREEKPSKDAGCCHGEPAPAAREVASAENAHTCQSKKTEAPPIRRTSIWRWPREAFRYGFIEVFDDIIVQLLIGLVLAGIIAALFPATRFGNIAGGSFVTYLIMLAAGVPVYVCATASTPIAAALVASGVSPGAAMVFLLAGPATNIASLLVLRNYFGRGAMIAYLVSIAVITVLLGLCLDALLGNDFTLPAISGAVHHHSHSLLHKAAGVALLVLAAVGLWRKGRISERIGLAREK